jgi:hypothetical protein
MIFAQGCGFLNTWWRQRVDKAIVFGVASSFTCEEASSGFTPAVSTFRECKPARPPALPAFRALAFFEK